MNRNNNVVDRGQSANFPVQIFIEGKWLGFTYSVQSYCFFDQKGNVISRDAVLVAADHNQVRLHNSKYWYPATRCGLQSCIDEAHKQYVSNQGLTEYN